MSASTALAVTLISTMQVLKKRFDTPPHEQIGVTRGCNNTNIHAVVDSLGNLLYVQLSGGQISNSTVEPDLLDYIKASDVVLVDKAYGSEEFRKKIEKMGASYCIPPKTTIQEPWDVDWRLYKEWNNVEHFFQKIKNYQRIATRYDKLAKRFLGFVHLACITPLLQRHKWHAGRTLDCNRTGGKIFTCQSWHLFHDLKNELHL